MGSFYFIRFPGFDSCRRLAVYRNTVKIQGLNILVGWLPRKFYNREEESLQNNETKENLSKDK